jgi:hypothetical protein
VVGDTELKKYITNYYKNRFSEPYDTHINMVETQRDDIPHVSDLENEILTAEFSETEIKEAIFQMEHNKAPRPDGFLAEFYQVFWEVIKIDPMALFIDFHEECLNLFSLNFGVI